MTAVAVIEFKFCLIRISQFSPLSPTSGLPRSFRSVKTVDSRPFLNNFDRVNYNASDEMVL